jgi:hypothetical protein
MVVPDFDLISEIMLVAEGFTEARLLARKFITLYTLCRELLSKQVSIFGIEKRIIIKTKAILILKIKLFNRITTIGA